jgi:HPr kinase/phosphorylase
MTETVEPRGVSVATVLRDFAESGGLDLELLAGAGGLERRITIPHTQKTGLALSGFDAYLRPGRVLVFGTSEVRYLETLTVDERVVALRRVFSHPLPCLLVTGGATPPAETIAEADRAGVPLLRSRTPTPDAISRLSAVLDAYLAARGMVHGVLMDILGLGVLVIGESGIGKSECALDLVVRGHRLVADDTVELRCRNQSFLIGTCPELTRHHMEIRGLGLINVQDLFGVASTRSSKRVELVVQLERWEHGREYDRLGLGVLVVGESGIGKSECALDLVVRGHRLVADDTVELRCRAQSFLIGTCPELTRHHMEIRGLGLINVQDLFGVASTRSSKRVELVVQLERWEHGREYDRLGLDEEFYDALGARIPMIRMPVAPGRNVAILVEVAARNQLLRSRGHHAARRLVTRLNERLAGQPADVDGGEDL